MYELKTFEGARAMMQWLNDIENRTRFDVINFVINHSSGERELLVRRRAGK